MKQASRGNLGRFTMLRTLDFFRLKKTRDIERARGTLTTTTMYVMLGPSGTDWRRLGRALLFLCFYSCEGCVCLIALCCGPVATTLHHDEKGYHLWGGNG